MPSVVGPICRLAAVSLSLVDAHGHGPQALSRPAIEACISVDKGEILAKGK
jgi:hypothetical protein